MTVRFTVICEAEADFRTGSGLADRVICQTLVWIEPETIDACRTWTGIDNESFLTWKDALRKADERGIRAHGFFDGIPGALDAKMARKAMLLLFGQNPAPDAIVLLRDDDGKTERRIGLEQARNEIRDGRPVPIVIGLAHVNRESWVLAGFVPKDERERTALEQAHSELGFDPAEHPEQLTANDEHAKKSSKRVLRSLISQDSDRESRCWTSTPLATLMQRGRQNGLTDYLAEVCQQLVPRLASPGSFSCTDFFPGQARS